MLYLKKFLQERQVTQAALAREMGYSPAVVAELCNKGLRPRSVDRADFDGAVDAALRKLAGVQFAVAWEKEVAEPGGNPDQPDSATPDENTEDTMILKNQRLTPAALRHFRLRRDPTADLQSADDLYVTDDYRDAREVMYQCATQGGFIALVGESGSGKTTLLEDLDIRLIADREPVILVRPYVLAMEDNDSKGKTLKSTHVAESLMNAVAPQAKVKSSPEARFAQLHQALRESAQAGYHHCLVIDEAHALPIPTLKHLKRLRELKLGHQRLVSVILIGQPELRVKMTERDYAVREVVQRCTEYTLPPLGDHLGGYVGHLMHRAGGDVGAIFAPGAIEAMRQRLDAVPLGTRKNGRGQVETVTASLLYPLAVNNLLAAALNKAADMQAPTVSAAIVAGV